MRCCVARVCRTAAGDAGEWGRGEEVEGKGRRALSSHSGQRFRHASFPASAAACRAQCHWRLQLFDAGAAHCNQCCDEIVVGAARGVERTGRKRDCVCHDARSACPVRPRSLGRHPPPNHSCPRHAVLFDQPRAHWSAHGQCQRRPLAPVPVWQARKTGWESVEIEDLSLSHREGATTYPLSGAESA